MGQIACPSPRKPHALRRGPPCFDPDSSRHTPLQGLHSLEKLQGQGLGPHRATVNSAFVKTDPLPLICYYLSLSHFL